MSVIAWKTYIHFAAKDYFKIEDTCECNSSKACPHYKILMVRIHIGTSKHTQLTNSWLEYCKVKNEIDDIIIFLQVVYKTFQITCHASSLSFYFCSCKFLVETFLFVLEEKEKYERKNLALAFEGFRLSFKCKFAIWGAI